MFVLRLAADVGFIDFDRSAITSAHLRKRTALHRFANAMEHEPCGLLSHSNSAMKFIARDAVLATANHPDSGHPLIEADRRILKNRPNLDGELLLAAVAEPEFPRFHKRVGIRAATRACNLVVRPAEKLRILKSAFRVSEVNYCLLKSYGFFHLSHLRSKNRVAQIVLCVKYVI